MKRLYSIIALTQYMMLISANPVMFSLQSSEVPNGMTSSNTPANRAKNSTIKFLNGYDGDSLPLTELAFEYGVDYPANDIASFGRITVDDCMRKCNNTPNCTAFVTSRGPDELVNTGAYNSVVDCWLKSSLGNRVANGDRITWRPKFTPARPKQDYFCQKSSVTPAHIKAHYAGQPECPAGWTKRTDSDGVRFDLYAAKAILVDTYE